MQGGAAVPVEHMKAHQQAVRRLTEWIAVQQAPGQLDGRAVVALSLAYRGQPLQRREVRLQKPFALG